MKKKRRKKGGGRVYGPDIPLGWGARGPGYRKAMGKKESAGKSSDAMGPADIAGLA